MTPAERSKAWRVIASINVPSINVPGGDLGRLIAWASLRDIQYAETEWAVNTMESVGIVAKGRAAEILK